MSKTIKIPGAYGFPIAKIYINGKEYTYPSEQDVEVPDEVASALENSIDAKTPTEELPYWFEIKVIENETRTLEETSSAGGRITDPEFAKMLLPNLANAKYYHLSGAEINPNFTPTITTSGSIVKAYLGSNALFVSVNTETSEIRMYSEEGGGGGIIVIPSATVTKYHPVLSKPCVPLWASSEESENLFIDKDLTIGATCEYLMEIFKGSKNALVIDGTLELCAPIVTEEHDGGLAVVVAGLISVDRIPFPEE